MPGPLEPMHIRSAGPADGAAVAQLLIASRRAHLPDVPLVHSDPDVHDWIAHVLIPGGGVRLALDDAGRALAFEAHAIDNGIGWIEQLYAAPGCTGRGIGARLLQQALRELHAAGAEPVRLWCFQSNTGARRFYERHGFVASAFTDGQGNEERCPDVLYERRSGP